MDGGAASAATAAPAPADVAMLGARSGVRLVQSHWRRGVPGCLCGAPAIGTSLETLGQVCSVQSQARLGAPCTLVIGPSPCEGTEP